MWNPSRRNSPHLTSRRGYYVCHGRLVGRQPPILRIGRGWSVLKPNLSNCTVTHAPGTASCSSAIVDLGRSLLHVYVEDSALLIFRRLHLRQQDDGTPMAERSPLVPLKNNQQMDCWCSRPGSIEFVRALAASEQPPVRSSDVYACLLCEPIHKRISVS